jgi:protein TonB
VSRHRRHQKSPVPVGRTLAIVAGIHVLLGAGVFMLAQTEVGQRMIKQYKVSLAQKEEKKEEKQPPKEEPPPPPPEQKLEAPPPDVAAAPMANAAAPQIGGGGGLAYGGKFAAPTGAGGAVGAFNASVERRFRQYYKEPRDDFSGAQLDLRIGGRGEVLSYQLARSSGNGANDTAILEAASKLQRDGVPAPPKGRERLVTVKVTPY